MEKQVSSWFEVESVPDRYVFPAEDRPGKLLVPLCKTIPVIDLGKSMGTLERTQTITQILKAAQTFGFFQVINHGVSENLLTDTMEVYKEFFNMPGEDKANIPNESGWIYTSGIDLPKHGVQFWRDNIKHICHPLEKCVQRWPQKPTRYREVVGTYLVEIRKMSLKILELICEGLGLEPGYLEDPSQVQLLSASNYPPCPDPSLTLGVPRHCDPSFITILYQGDASGLQVFKDDQWIGVEALPNAFVVNIGNQLQIISNGKLKSSEHRAVTNTSKNRTTITTFINPSFDFVIEPAKGFVNELNPPLYGSIQQKHYVKASNAFGFNTEELQKGISSEH